MEKLLKFNIRESQSIEEAIFEKNIIITMLPDGNIVKNVWASILINIKKPTLLVDCSTIDIKTCKEIHKMAKNKNCHSLDAPVSGGEKGAIDGTLTFMVGEKKSFLK